MQIGKVIIEDEFAEAFRMWAARVVVTAIDDHWLRIATSEVCGYGTSVIGCDAEAGVERFLSPDETLDGRPGASLLFFAFNADGLRKAVPNRVGQCLMTCPTTAVYDGLPDVIESDATARIDVGKKLRFFGDGNQKSKVVEGRDEGTKGRRDEGNPINPQSAIRNPQSHSRRFWRIPVMDGEFTCEETIGAMKSIAGGNFLVCGRDQRSTLDATKAAVDSIAKLPDCVTPFPGGIVRSGSKVGSRYKGMFASTNDEYCPTLRGIAKNSKLREGVMCVYEIVINGLSEAAIAGAMKAGITAACGHDIIAISAGNYGGKLGKFHFKLREVMV
ncbi:MAG: formylmethanofuran--tetrahydromethanopterin N-formyltransferase [Phycisphaeraceae bacterium]